MEVLYKRGKLIYLIRFNGKHYTIHLYKETISEISDPDMFIKQGYVEDANPTEEIKKNLIEIYEQNKV